MHLTIGHTIELEITIRFAQEANCVEMCVTQYTEYKHAKM